MKVIIAGSRSFHNTAGLTNLALTLVQPAVIASEFHITQVVSGTARGIDVAGEYWAEHLRYLPVRRFPADWDTLGRSAGHARNLVMAEYADAAIIIWDGISRGTEDMIRIMRESYPGKPLHVDVVRP